MSEAVLVAVIQVICGGSVSEVGYRGDTSTKEARIDCYEKLVNCAVGANGKIMEFKEFNVKCVKAGK